MAVASLMAVKIPAAPALDGGLRVPLAVAALPAAISAGVLLALAGNLRLWGSPLMMVLATRT